MSLIAGKYRYVRRLGGGTYGDVQLVFDPNQRQVALKMIPKKMIRQQPYLQEYIQGEKQCMMSVKGPYTVELYEVFQDQEFIYFACEYCDGGDLLSYQAKQPNKVFTLKQAIKILSQIILGLQLLHRTGYLHRDIKPQNILVKKKSNGQHLFKLADFGFAKKIQNSSGTVLGTQNYMSPEIYANSSYGFQVDMWAFGVLFYFMLNMEMPFSFNAHIQAQTKRQELINEAKDFSYSQRVKNTKKKIVENCTAQMQDLFKKMFEVDQKKRINFAKIRTHPIFKQYFPNVSEQSSKIYLQKPRNRFQDFMEQRLSGVMRVGPGTNEIIQIQPSKFLNRANSNEQKQIVQLELQRIKFLGQSNQELCSKLGGFIDRFQLLGFSYNVYKYYVILLRNFVSQLNGEFFKQKYPKLKWNQFFKSGEAQKLKQIVQGQLSQMQIHVSQTYDSCWKNWNQIKKYNPKLQAILEAEVSEKSFSGKLKQSYRCSTSGIFAKLRQKMNINNHYAYFTLLIFLAHAYNNIIITEQEDLHELFIQFVKDKKLGNKMIDFRELRAWLTNQNKETLKQLIALLNKKYFSNS